MLAQQIIDESNFTNFKEIFYPELDMQEKTDLNITKILRDLK
jgi:hypothetical protein